MFYNNITFAMSLQINNIMVTLAPNCKTIHNSEEQCVLFRYVTFRPFYLFYNTFFVHFLIMLHEYYRFISFDIKVL